MKNNRSRVLSKKHNFTSHLFIRMRKLLLLGLILGMGVVSLYYWFDPSTSGWFPRCTFFVFTGWKCPSCGSQRAIHLLLHGNFELAWTQNALLFVALPYLLLLLLARLMRKTLPQGYSWLTHQWVVLSFMLLTIVWWIVRNL